MLMWSGEGKEERGLEELQADDLLLNNKELPGGVCGPVCPVWYFHVHLELNKSKIYTKIQPWGRAERTSTIYKQMPGFSLPRCECLLAFKKRNLVNLCL